MQVIDWKYNAVVFDNFAEFEKQVNENVDLFPTLLNVKINIDDEMIASVREPFSSMYDKSTFENSSIMLFPNFQEFGAYEFYDGWYSNFISDLDFKGAPKLDNFIDFSALGEALERTFDTNLYLQVNNAGAVIELLDV